MTSQEIFKDDCWQLWSAKLFVIAPKGTGVYMMRLCNNGTLQRLKGSSDILYVGSAQNISARLKIHATVRDDQKDIGYRLSRISIELTNHIEIAWELCQSKQAARWREGELLKKFEVEHIELPPLNRQESGRGQQYLIKLLHSLPLREQNDIVEKYASKKGFID